MTVYFLQQSRVQQIHDLNCTRTLDLEILIFASIDQSDRLLTYNSSYLHAPFVISSPILICVVVEFNARGLTLILVVDKYLREKEK